MTHTRSDSHQDDVEPIARECWRAPGNRAAAVLIAAAAMVAVVWLFQAQKITAGWGMGTSGKLIAAAIIGLVAGWCCLYVLFRPRQKLADHRLRDSAPTSPEAIDAAGLGPLSDQADPKELYLDQVKRSVTNILYEDPPFWFYDHHHQPALASGYSLSRRVRGEDSPTVAHTMVGVRRLEQLQSCVEDVLRRNVPGDLIETGSYRGGVTIFMRALLKAHGVQDRKVFVCDAFVPPSPPQPPLVLAPVLQALAAIPHKAWQRWYLLFLQRLQRSYFQLLERISGQTQAFPDVENPSEELITFTHWNLVNPVWINRVDETSLSAVQSTFARYGLLDEQVVFLPGFFAETLPAASFDRFAVVRLDGDTYESTWDAISILYPKLSPGGYLIIDDYHSFSDCRRAIEQYRTEQNINDPLAPIDNLAVYWVKS